MPQASFDISLHQPLVISQQSASAGAHHSLDYIPGSILLGLAASRLYSTLDQDSAWLLFHSGLVRFGDALPLQGQQVARPMPMCWHYTKGESYKNSDTLKANTLFDPSMASGDTNRQPVQMRNGYVTEHGQTASPEKVQTLKTAIDPKTGKAAESQLFGYEALAANQTFRFVLSADDITQELWDKLKAALSGRAQLGRSRSAQFGKVMITPAKEAAHTPPASNDNQLTLWLQSDLLLEHNGQPCLQPLPELIGLPEGSHWLADSSFLRARRYSLYNAYRRHYDSERQVISRGSVLRYELPHALSEEQLNTLQQGIGLQIESGLGQVLVNPHLLSQTKPSFKTAISLTTSTAQTPHIKQPDTLLIQALVARLQRRTGEQRVSGQARDLFSKFCQQVALVRRYLATPAGNEIMIITKERTITAPGKSQWGRLKQAANDHRTDPQALWTALFNNNDGALRQRSGWELPYSPTASDTLSEWLQAKLEPYKKQADFPQLIGQLAALGHTDEWQACCKGNTSTKSKESQHSTGDAA
jgi:CRISPR-associated protein Csx10